MEEDAGGGAGEWAFEKSIELTIRVIPPANDAAASRPLTGWRVAAKDFAVAPNTMADSMTPSPVAIGRLSVSEFGLDDMFGLDLSEVRESDHLSSSPASPTWQTA